MADTQTTAVPLGNYRVVVVHMDTSSEMFGCFQSEDEAIEWAMQYRHPLGLAACASWRIEEHQAHG